MREVDKNRSKGRFLLSGLQKCYNSPMISRIKAFFTGATASMSKSKVVTRFAPSPTGFLHAGNYRTAVFAYLYAQQNKGKFVLRVEDTDTARSKKEFEDNILESLAWLGLPYDEMYRQSERGELYKQYLQKLLDNGTAFVSKEAPKKKVQKRAVVQK